ncbi:hypothetical protein L3X38_025273 [Prunus dulcis]|uniref:Retrovirus-related Pol polyprotein from transposon TNT 1-94-like beta-barrel domain-containing protein n=1 Tax=Prunus dulcis TaxID=3755 RepID=A0AAD4Z6W9_PRUDU|nr:hypothetical protein L3X38_025273 [Prunus dulcis]
MKDDFEHVAEQIPAFVIDIGNNGKVLKVSASVLNNTWIIDSSATEHMSFDSKQVQTIKSSPQLMVSTVDGNADLVIGEDTISLTDNLSLDTILVVPSLDYNLLSVTQLTVALKLYCDFLAFLSVQGHSDSQDD